MSKDSADKPDEYEGIFDETNVEKMNSEAKIIDVAGDAATDKDSKHQTIENDLDINLVYKQENLGSIDAEDIEDGIFAPERKTIKSSKKIIILNVVSFSPSSNWCCRCCLFF